MSHPPAQTTTEPIEQDEEDRIWEAAAETGEAPDSATRDVLGLVHRAVDRFPDLTERYRRYAGPAAVVSGALIVLAGIAVARRVRRGEHPARILEELTSAEIESAAREEHQERRRLRPRPWRRRKKQQQEQEVPPQSG